MGVGVQCEARRVVAQHGGQGFHIHTVLESQDREGVPIGYNKDTTEFPINQGFSDQSLVIFDLKAAQSFGKNFYYIMSKQESLCRNLSHRCV